MRFVNYDRQSAVDYAKLWAKARNSRYMNFDGMGGDCTNFASQCLFAGTGIMNYKKDGIIILRMTVPQHGQEPNIL